MKGNTVLPITVVMFLVFSSVLTGSPHTYIKVSYYPLTMIGKVAVNPQGSRSEKSRTVMLPAEWLRWIREKYGKIKIVEVAEKLKIKLHVLRD